MGLRHGFYELPLQVVWAGYRGLDRAVFRKGVHLLGQGPVPGDAFQHHRRAHGAVAAVLVVGENEAPVLLASEQPPVRAHGTCDDWRSDGGVLDLPARRLGDLLDEGRCGHGDHDLASPVPAQDVPGEQCQGHVAAHVPPVPGDEDAPVGVAVVCDAQVRAGVDYHALQCREVVLRGLAGVPGELPLGVAVQRYGPHAEPAHELGGRVHGGSVGAVHAHGQSGVSYEVGVDGGDDGLHVLVPGALDPGDRADLPPADAFHAGLVEVLDPRLLLGGAFGPVPGDALYPVELWGVVGRGDHHASGDLGAVLDEVLERGCRNHAQVQNVRADRHEARREGALDHLG